MQQEIHDFAQNFAEFVHPYGVLIGAIVAAISLGGNAITLVRAIAARWANRKVVVKEVSSLLQRYLATFNRPITGADQIFIDTDRYNRRYVERSREPGDPKKLRIIIDLAGVDKDARASAPLGTPGLVDQVSSVITYYAAGESFPKNELAALLKIGKAAYKAQSDYRLEELRQAEEAQAAAEAKAKEARRIMAEKALFEVSRPVAEGAEPPLK